MTVFYCNKALQYLSKKEVRRLAAEGLNAELNGMCPEDQDAFWAAIDKKAKCKRSRSQKSARNRRRSPGVGFDDDSHLESGL